MRPLQLILGPALVVTLVAGCASTDPDYPTPTAEVVAESAAPSAEELPPGFYFEGEFVELGDFDPDGPVDLINMCDGLSDEVLQKAGMKRVEASEPLHSGRGMVCTFESLNPEDEWGNFGFMADAVPKSRLAELDLLIEAEPSSSIPGAFTSTSDELSQDQDCYASVGTTRGRVSIDFHDYSRPLSQVELCNKAIDALETIYAELRGK